MRTAFVDTSVLAAIALGEHSAHAARKRLAVFDRLNATSLLEAELYALLLREGTPAEQRVGPWLAGIEWVYPDRSLRPEIEAVLDAGYVRGADCWHLATALYFATEPADISFVTLDARQGEVARALGFKR